MHRVWIFPLLVGLVASLYLFVISVQGWMGYGYLVPTVSWALTRVSPLHLSAPWGFLVGIMVGIITAWSEMLRFGTHDRSGLRATQRLVGNGLWLAFYALLLNGATFLIIVAIVEAGLIGTATIRNWFPFIFFVSFGSINLTAIVWTLMRTSTTEDILSPLILGAKLKSSLRLG